MNISDQRPFAAWACTIDSPVPDDVARILGTLPEWFGIPESNEEYVDAARSKETWTVRDAEGIVRGTTLVDYHFAHSAEIYFTAVEREYHGQGIGRCMVRAIVEHCRDRGIRLLQVKTLGASHPDPGYARTRTFYESVGFFSLEETDLWGEDNPCLVMVLPIGAAS